MLWEQIGRDLNSHMVLTLQTLNSGSLDHCEAILIGSGRASLSHLEEIHSISSDFPLINNLAMSCRISEPK